PPHATTSPETRARTVTSPPTETTRPATVDETRTGERTEVTDWARAAPAARTRAAKERMPGREGRAPRGGIIPEWRAAPRGGERRNPRGGIRRWETPRSRGAPGR